MKTLLSTLMALISLLATAQNPPKLYPYGDEFSLGLYAINRHFSEASSQNWNNGHIYIYKADTNGVIHHPNLEDFYQVGNNNTSFRATPVPDKYFNVCTKYSMNAKGRLSWLTDNNISPPLDYATDTNITIDEINQQKVHSNLSWWDIPEEQRWWEPSEMSIVKDYKPLTRNNDQSQRPNYMYLPGNYDQNDILKYVPHLDILPVSCYTTYQGANLSNFPVSYIRWAIERTQKAITEPTLTNQNGFTIGKDYLNGEKTVVAILELAGLDTVNQSNQETVERIKHDFWLALACDVQGIELYNYHMARVISVSPNTTYHFLEAPWDSLNAMVTIFKDNDMDKVQLNGIMDTNLYYNILSGPANTVLYPWDNDDKPATSPINLQYPSIKLQAKKWMGDTYVIAVNSTDSTVVYDIPVSTTSYQLSYENLITNQSRSWTEDAIHPPGHINSLHIIDTLPPLGVSVFKYKSSTTLDLSMRDCLNDNGYDAGYRKDLEDIDNSPDIWVRDTNDGFLNKEHESPTYSQQDPLNYVYVRVKNISSEPSGGNEILNLHWTRNGMHPQWPIMWDGSTPNVGNLISSQTIPILQANEDAILEFEWTIIPDSTGGGDWGHCLLARIENTNGKDEIVAYPNNLSEEVFNNNNISLRNCEIIHNPIIQNFAGLYHVVKKTLNLGNSSSIGDFYDITFQVPQFFRTSSLIDNVSVNVKFDAQGWSLFQNSINNTEGLNISGEHEINLTGFETTFESIYLPANTELPTTLTFDFLIQNDSTAEYEFLVSSQTSIADDNGEYWRGNVRYIVKNNPRDPFDADAGEDKEIDRGESTLLCAELINEAAIYNWYDMEGNLIYTGTDLSISPEVSERYRLEVIATADGLTCYDQVDVEVNPYFITNVSPNPASTTVTIDYFAEGASSAYLMLLSYTNGTASNYIINPTSTQTNINIANYQTGIYSVILVCDGVHYTIENLVVQ